jgi:hypothetical protein
MSDNSSNRNTLQLSQNFIEFARNWTSDPANASKIQEINQKGEEGENQDSGNLVQYISEVYFKKHAIRIVRESSIEDEGKGLQSSNLI